MNKLVSYLYILLVFSYIMLGNHAWFFWFLEDGENSRLFIMVQMVGMILSYLFLKIKKIRLIKSPNVIIGFMFFLIAYMMQGDLGIGKLVLTISTIFTLWVLLSCATQYEYILKHLLILFSIILIPGMVLHIYMLINGILPGIPIFHPNNDNYYFFNYFVLLKGIGNYENDGLRFQSIFLEPGFLGTLMSFLLYTFRYNFAKYKLAWILLISLLLSLSLAGYILGMIGFILCQWSKGKKFISYIVVGIFLIIIVYISKTYNNGHNYLNEKIVERLEPEKGKGISGNNRVGDGTDYYFKRSLENGTFWFGIGTTEITKLNGGKGWENTIDYDNQIRGAGYKIFILRSGVICAFFYLLFYYFLSRWNKVNRKYSVGFFFIIIATFIQAAYPESYAWLFPFILGVFSQNEQLNQIKSKK